MSHVTCHVPHVKKKHVGGGSVIHRVYQIKVIIKYTHSLSVICFVKVWSPHKDIWVGNKSSQPQLKPQLDISVTSEPMHDRI